MTCGASCAALLFSAPRRGTTAVDSGPACARWGGLKACIRLSGFIRYVTCAGGGAILPFEAACDNSCDVAGSFGWHVCWTCDRIRDDGQHARGMFNLDAL